MSKDIFKNKEGYTDITAGKAISEVTKRKRIPRDSWAITERIIRRYPDQREEYFGLLDEIYSASPVNDGQPKGTDISNPTERKVMSAFENPKLLRLEREIKAVEKVYQKLRPEHQKIIRVRFWSSRWKNRPYLKMQDTEPYCERHLKRICEMFIKNVAAELGEY